MKWSPNNAEKNKPLQKELLKVGLKLLKPTKASCTGGVLLYSTCSLNPVENEEVIGEVLEEMNSNGTYIYEIVDLGDLSNRESSGRSGGNFLRVLPAASHGGFFVCAIRKSCMEVNADKDLKCNSSHSVFDELVETKEEVCTYTVSSCTKECCIDLAKIIQTSDIQLIGCGVPITYQSNNTQYTLQEGCSCIVSCGLVPSIAILSIEGVEFINRIAVDSGQLTLPLATCNFIANDQSHCIVNIQPSNTNLPGRILRIDEASQLVTVGITARPQIMKRVLSNIRSSSKDSNALIC
jgi:hypothetical protein